MGRSVMGPKDLPKGTPLVINAAAFHHKWTAVRVVSYDKKKEVYSVVVEWDNEVDGITFRAGDTLMMHRHCFFDLDEDIQGDDSERERLREHLRSGAPAKAEKEPKKNRIDDVVDKILSEVNGEIDNRLFESFEDRDEDWIALKKRIREQIVTLIPK